MALIDDSDGNERIRQRWAAIFVRERLILMQLLRAFSDAKTTERETKLLRLALDFHAIQQEHEHAWVEVPQLKRLDGVIDDLALQLEGSQPGTSLYRARAQ